MKKFSLNFIHILYFALAASLIVSCDDENKSDPNGNDTPCANVTCDPGLTCMDGVCVENTDDIEVVTGEISTNTTWTNDKIYLLDKKAIVLSGVTLTIEKGTIIKGKAGQLSTASALVITQGAKIMAEGTADQPIIFTAASDNIAIGQKFGTNLGKTDRGLWGGVIIMGNAPCSIKGTGESGFIEGLPSNQEYNNYGGDNPADNSGVLKYVSIRHGGIAISDGNEINGLTMGGVGNGTVVDNVEVISNLDDGIEWFGGTVNATNLVVAYCGDDGLDLDQNFAGTISNAMVVQEYGGDKALEFDGPEHSGINDGGLFTLTGATLISVNGAGSGASLKSKAQGTITNTCWFNYGTGIKIRASFNPESCTHKTDAYNHYVDGSLKIENSEVVASTNSDVIKVYVDDEDPQELACFEGNPDLAANYQANAYNILTDPANNNQIVTTPSGNVGANTSVLEWTWTISKGNL